MWREREADVFCLEWQCPWWLGVSREGWVGPVFAPASERLDREAPGLGRVPSCLALPAALDPLTSLRRSRVRGVPSQLSPQSHRGRVVLGPPGPGPTRHVLGAATASRWHTTSYVQPCACREAAVNKYDGQTQACHKGVSHTGLSPHPQPKSEQGLLLTGWATMWFIMAERGPGQTTQGQAGVQGAVFGGG